MSKKVVLGKDTILDSWSVLIEGAQGKSREFYDLLLKLIGEQEMPHVRAEMVTAFPHGGAKVFSAFFESVKALGREYLMVSHDRLKPHKMFVGARDYGKNLSVSWYLVCEISFLDALFKKREEKIIYTPIYLFDQEELTSYVTCAHHCVLKAVESIMNKVGQDFSKVDRKSKGFLGVS